MLNAPALRTAGDFYQLCVRLGRERRPFAVATVLETGNSTPVKAGAKAIIERRGKIHGTVGGGAVEAEAIRRAKGVLESGRSIIYDYELRGADVSSSSPICGGAMRVLVAPGSYARAGDYQRAARTLAQRQRGLWMTTMASQGVLKATARFLPEMNLGSEASIPAVVQHMCLKQRRPQLLEPQTGHQQSVVFLEPLLPEPLLLIIGGGHVSQALAAQASLVGFDIVVMEDRPEFACPAAFPPRTRTSCGPVEKLLTKFPINQDTYVVIVTRGHRQDALALRGCIRSPAAYIGMIGSRRKVPLVRSEFVNSGWATAEEFKRVYAPIGMDLGAVTVPEIAASIVAQIIAVRRKGEATRMPLS